MAKQRKKRGRPSSNNSVIEAEEETENEVKNDEVSGYEQSRDQRIKENLQRMQKLGILDLSRQLNPPSKRPKKNPSQKKPSLPSSDPPRRPSPSSRIKFRSKNGVCFKFDIGLSLRIGDAHERHCFTFIFFSPFPPSKRIFSTLVGLFRLMAVTRVTYKEVSAPKKKHKSEESDEIEIVMKEGSKPEIYTEEDEKLLGDCETAWILNVDGYGEDGERIYDPFFGKSCHQCRQKTIGHRTNCSKCKLGRGQFCGDCLYTRYGENILEANQNPNWICPVCRGICNCSRCRRAKGWEPTAAIYTKVSKRGFKSVAHYLIQTRRSQTKQEEPADGDLVSADKSPFADVEVKSPLHDEGVDSQLTHDGVPNPQSQDNNNVEEYSDDEYKEEDDNHDSTDTDDDDDDDDDDD
ncbi:cell division cycle-associated protein 7-like [Camellia sinensis]|uniref:cell division cycle-associated protein 7-like n=1 Tax=Camellia sinensis TaxID=4442 RepID=UPI0010358190|nr:cell division cycle-associated protein 7-like [Camellia sinensis]